MFKVLKNDNYQKILCDIIKLEEMHRHACIKFEERGNYKEYLESEKILKHIEAIRKDIVKTIRADVSIRCD